MRSKFVIFILLASSLCGFKNNREFAFFYDVYVQDVATAINGTPNDLTGVQKFNNQYFTLWLSPVAGELPYPKYYKQIVEFCSTYNIRKIIWYIAHGTADLATFYNPGSTDPGSFVQLLQNHPLPPFTQIEFYFDCSSMPSPTGSDPSYVYQGTSPSSVYPPPPNPSTFTVQLPQYMAAGYGNFYNCLWWAMDMFRAVTNVTLISGVSVDPEDNCSGLNTPYTTNASAYQALVNYMDEFSSLDADFQPLERGMTFGGDAKVQIFGNRSVIPISDPLLITDTDSIPNFYNGTTGPRTAPWRSAAQAADPFLDNVYPQLYNLSTPYIYTLSSVPATAGLNFLELLSDTPYCPGVVAGQTPSPTATRSQISFTAGSPLITGTNTQFNTELASSGLNTQSPIGYILNNQQYCAAPNTDPNYPNTPSNITCGGKVAGVATATTMNLAPSPTTTQTNVNWLYVENEIQYREYHLTPQMVSGIFLMFSGESSFFGGWTLDQFMDFVIAFYNQGQTSYSPYFSVSGGVGTPIPVPNQFAIFTYEQITGQASGAPNPSWFSNPN